MMRQLLPLSIPQFPLSHSVFLPASDFCLLPLLSFKNVSFHFILSLFHSLLLSFLLLTQIIKFSFLFLFLATFLEKIISSAKISFSMPRPKPRVTFKSLPEVNIINLFSLTSMNFRGENEKDMTSFLSLHFCQISFFFFRLQHSFTVP